MTLGGPVTREGAREEARRELSRSIYHDDHSGWWNRLLGWIGDRIVDLISRLVPHGAGGGDGPGFGVLSIVVVVAVVLVALRWWLGPVRRTARARPPAEDDLSSPLSAAQLRAEADNHAALGDYLLAVRSRLRAIVRTLEDRGLLDPRPGRTAGELVADVAGAVAVPRPANADRGRPKQEDVAPANSDHALSALAAAVQIFSDTWYGGRPGSAADYQVLVDADTALSRLRPTSRGHSDAAGMPAVPA
ncbi:DUF4129 domain-containing protein [Frankia sp. AgKG'84/4]|uniref:DUF4129 domain-containing protein n=1 Tax=Frankia sp. AgKG'84/4 TaxID=573490 RepID=UPI00200D0595|nr:DUF4129 domain-containing protein [Frankia sp. AgKG'84/4]MCL9794745.1 DUF4129 domain-containing protein [Frankia sp. AgKG'84/4]